MASISPQARQGLRGLGFWLSALLVALSWMVAFPSLIAVRLAGALHTEAALATGRKPWALGIEVSVRLVGGAA
jgi:hypothetical protein